MEIVSRISVYLRTGYRPTSSRGSDAGIGVAGAASIGRVADVETSGAGEVSAAGVSGSEVAGVGVVSVVAGVVVSGSGTVSVVDVVGVEVSNGTAACLGCLSWANRTCLTWVDNELKEPVNICDTELQGTT